MGVLWYKIWFDLWHYKARTLLAVLSIAAGVFAVGTMFGMSDLLSANMDRSHQAVLAPHINILLGQLVDYDTLINVREVAGVEDVEPYNSVSVLYKLHPQDDWRPGIFHVRRDYEQQTYELVQLRQGRWPEKGEVGVERMAAQFLGVGIGDQVIFRIDGKERRLPITGLIRHPFVPPPQFMDMAFFFVDSEELERVGISVGEYNACFVRVNPYSPEHAREVATAIKQRLAKQDIRIEAFLYQDPNKHWGSSFLDGFALVLKLMALVSVLMSAMLVYNTIAFLVVQQANQIGVLKAVGGTTPAILGVYLAGAFVYGLLALLLSAPLSALAASFMTGAFLNIYNIDYTTFQVSQEAVIYQVICALAVPLFAGLVPALQAANLTVRQAISSYGLGGGSVPSRMQHRVDALFGHFLPPLAATVFGNLFRRGGRLMLTQLVLVTAGAAFLVVMSLNSSMAATLDHLFARRHYDTTLNFTQNERLDRVEMLARSVAGVDQLELRLVQNASMYVEGRLVKEAGIGTSLTGTPAGSSFFTPLMVSGRWLEPGDGQVVVLPREAASDNRIQIGDTVTLDLGELGEDSWLVIGTYEPVFASGFNQDVIYAPLDALFAATKKQNQGSVLLVRTSRRDPGFTAEVTRRLKDLFESRNIKVSQSQTEAELLQLYEFQFSTVTSMLYVLSLIVGMVGGIALTGSLSIGVVERTKEIGVLRAIGARSPVILGIFILEGLLQGLLSWALAVPLSLLLSPPLASTLGHSMFGATLDFQYSWQAVGAWLGVILVVSLLASILPALGAARISVRDSLAYD